MNYAEIYKTVITKYKQNPSNKQKEYCEDHHINPKSFGGTDDYKNIVTLPVRVHIFCHELLYMMSKQSKDKAKTAWSAWALKRFANGKSKQKKSVKHCFKSRFFAKVIELGKKFQKNLRWITNEVENDQIFYWQPLPNGWRWGMKKCRRANKWITNGKINKRIYDEDVIPDGWRLGITHAKDYDQIWITNGKVDKHIHKGELIPVGWRQGISKARNNGMIWIHKKGVLVVKGNCVQIKKDSPIPDGWEIGYGQTWMAGKIKITNGINERKILPTDKIPEGWYIGGKPHGKNKKKIITDGITNRFIDINDSIPEGWHYGSAQSKLHKYQNRMLSLKMLETETKIPAHIFKYGFHHGKTAEEIIQSYKSKQNLIRNL